MARRRFMQSFPGISARFRFAAEIHPALNSFADEACATFARLFAYMAMLALLGILAIHGWDQLQDMLADESADKPGWSVADRSYPAFAVSQPDSHEKSASYTILRHPEGGRKDLLRWTSGEKPKLAELFAHAELKRSGCTGVADWLNSAENPQLRGAF
jgi:hypothetical protein